MKRVTIKDVAKEAGVSVSAVSRVFTDGASASAPMREKVRLTAESLGYRPSLLARGLVQERTNLITLVIGRLNGAFDALFLDAFADAVARTGARLLLASADSGRPNEGGLLQALDYQSDAAVVAAGTMPLDHSEKCLRAGLPIVLVGRVVDMPGVDCVLADNIDGARQAGELLLRTGCRRIAYLGRGGATFSDMERREGIRGAVDAAKGELIVRSIDGKGAEAKFDAAASLLSQHRPPDAIFCASDSIALGAVEAARALGMRVPEDVSIIGFNNVPIAGWRSFRLSTIDYPIKATVDAILELLDERLNGPERPSVVRRIPTRLVVRGTTRAIAP